MKLSTELKKLQNKEKAKILSKFFKTGKGEYGEGDLFLGIQVPKQREIVKRFWDKIDLKELAELLYSRFHEERLTALLILVKKYEKSSNKKKIVSFYLKNLRRVNNWDLVDLSAPNILGDFLLNRNKKVLYRLVKSKDLWARRISIVSTFSLIRKNRFEDALNLSKILLSDSHNLIHKAVGWMLREIGKRDLSLLEDFIEQNYKKMSRITLRYSIERMPESKRIYYLAKQ